MTNSRCKLWAVTVECISGFNQQTHTVDSHAEVYLNSLQPKLDEDEDDFLRQVFYGVTRYRATLETVVKKYISVMKRMPDSHVSLLMLTYLAMFRIEELGIANFKSVINGSSSHNRIAEFLTFVFTPGNAEEHFVPEWKSQFDDNYVDTVLLNYIKTSSDQFLNLAASFQQMATGLEALRQQQIGGGRVFNSTKTVQLPFKLSQPRERKQPREPSPRTAQLTNSRKSYRKPVEDVTEEKKMAIQSYKNKIQASSLPKIIKEENRKKEASIPSRPPMLSTASRSAQQTNRLPSTVEAPPEAKTVPCISPARVRQLMSQEPVEKPKLTNAALLREEAVFTKKVAEEEEILKRKIIEMRDDTEFRNWQQAMQEKDDIIKKTLIAQRKVEMMLADEEGRVARRKAEQRKAREASVIKSEIEESMQRLNHQREKELYQTREYVKAQTEANEINLAKSKLRMKQERIDNARLVKEEDMLLELKAAERLELDLQRKSLAIKERKIQAENRPAYKKEFDPDTTMGFGTLNEMSLSELQTKLVTTKQVHEEAVACKHSEIEQQRYKQKEKQEDRLASILQRRSAARQIAAAKRTTHQQQVQREKEKQQNKEKIQLQALQAKLQEKRENRAFDEEQRKAEDRKRRLSQQLRSADGGAIEHKKWMEMERGQENISKSRQLRAIETLKTDQTTSQKVHRQRTICADAQHARNRSFLAQQTESFLSQREQRRVMQEAEKLAVTSAAATELSERKARRMLKDSRTAIDTIATL
eukprot:TRINITY_DN18879_c0_g1_i1.p1 TRINITY_DN18879_c0_g1~~TRINITY_DN18879_c0_g1_i1.p1  ORF type:complete len:759 (+),score=164.00 TRINITY_DN18879_c0_g1_i1:66-2342(+)